MRTTKQWHNGTDTVRSIWHWYTFTFKHLSISTYVYKLQMHVNFLDKCQHIQHDTQTIFKSIQIYSCVFDYFFHACLIPKVQWGSNSNSRAQDDILGNVWLYSFPNDLLSSKLNLQTFGQDIDLIFCTCIKCMTVLCLTCGHCTDQSFDAGEKIHTL